MPRVEPYPGDRVQTKAPARVRQTVEPNADVFGAAIGVGLQQLGRGLMVAANEVAEIEQAQRQRANENFAVEQQRGYNQLNQIMGLGTDRGAQGVRGLLTMEGKEAHENYQANVKEWDAQSDMLVKQAKTPDQRLIAERMRNTERARYTDMGLRHATAEYQKYEAKQTEALRVSNINLAAAVADKPGGLEMAAEIMRQNDLLVDQFGEKMGLHSQAQKDNVKAQQRSDNHVVIINKLLTSGQDKLAEVHFNHAMAGNEILETQAAAIRDKVTTATRNGDAERIASAIFDAHKPAIGSMGSLPTSDMHRLAGEQAPDTKTATLVRQHLSELEAAWDKQQRNEKNARLDSMFTGFFNGNVSLADVKKSAAYINAHHDERQAIEAAYQQRDQQARAEARAARSDAREQYNFDQSRREAEGWGSYYTMTDPQNLADKERGEILADIAGENLSNRQREMVLDEWRRIQGVKAAGGVVSIDKDMFNEVAYDAGLTYVYTPYGQLSKEQRERLGALKGAVNAAIAAKENADSAKTGVRRKLDPNEQKELMQGIVSQKVTSPGMLWDTTYIVATLKPDEKTQQLIVPWKDIGDNMRKAMRNFIRSEKVPDGVVSTNQMPDMEIDSRYQNAMERAAAAAMLGGGPEVWTPILRDAINAVKDPYYRSR